ncbi:MAG: gltX [Candidatus Parcubacteria bacterium]|nr:gltX [Candidatus Parcubacteria bacterium]
MPDMSTEKVVTRFAPSPTGFMHIGGVRTALFAYLWARKNSGTFILRIEDTDKEREVAGSIDHIQQALAWLGIEWDFGPKKPGPFGSCIQSERLAIYKEFAEKLAAAGHAYPDPYTPAEVDAFRKQSEAAKKPFLFRDFRPATFGAWDGKQTLRLKVPEIKRFKWHDAVRGDLEAGEEALDDFVLMKADGYPTYNFAHIIDDHLMGVTHVMRGDEFISSTPRFLSLYQALGFTPPIFVTLPPILRDDRTKKLGKRDGAKDVLEYRIEGYLPEAMANFLAFIGWNPGTEEEVFTMKELINRFEIEKIHKAGGAYNEEKLAWFNRQHLLRLSDESFAEHAATFLPDSISTTSAIFSRLLPVMRDKITLFNEISALFHPEGELHFVTTSPDYPADRLLWKKNPSRETAGKHLTEARKLLAGMPAGEFDGNPTEAADKIKAAVFPYAEANGRGDVLWPLRVALTGQDKSPDPFMSAAILGQQESLRRIDLALTKLSAS